MIGSRIAQYEVERHLGSGGMGDVYLARDTRLGRKVAIKLLPDGFASDPERVSRFEREARVLASMTHANIAALYGLEQADGRLFLAMELVEGETLAERVARGPLPVREAFDIARQIADALETAHAKGIVHRDLKPANVKTTPDGRVKVLDFGLAKALSPVQGQQDILSSPTMSIGATNAGMILGTAAYMSPEQAKGREVDQRADIFAFGCVLFELLTGRRSFGGDTVTEAIASILAREPDLTQLPPNVHPRVHDVLRRCFEKDPARRWQAIGDLRFELEALLADPHGARASVVLARPRPLWKRVLPIAATAIAAAGATALGILMLRPAPVSPTPVRFTYTLPSDQSFTRTGRHVLAMSPDGLHFAYVADSQLYLKVLSEKVAKPIPGTNQDVNTPAFSPDGKWLAFCSVPEGKLKKIAIVGGASVTLASIDNPYGMYWAPNDQILVGQGAKGIVRVSAAGGAPETVVTVKSDEIAQSPQLLPDGETLLFTLIPETTSEWDKGQIVTHSLKSGERKVLVDGGSDGRYLPTGHIVYLVGRTLFAVPFNLKTMAVTGGPTPVVERVGRASCCTAAGFFATSETGSLVAIPGNVARDVYSLALVQRNGEKKRIDVQPADYFSPRFSPDGRHIAVGAFDPQENLLTIWLLDLTAKSALRRLTFEGNSRTPLWTPDGRRIVFVSDREKGGDAIFSQPADGSGAAERLTAPQKGIWLESVSPDGRTMLLGTSATANPGSEIWMVSLDGDRMPKPLVQAPGKSVHSAAFSPDGRWFAYQDDSNRGQIYVQPFPPTGAKYLVSTNSGRSPIWSRDGQQLLYMTMTTGTAPEQLMAVDVKTRPSFTFSAPTPLPVEVSGGGDYDVSPDGRQFVVVLPPSETQSGDRNPLTIDVVLHWFEELKARK